MRIVVGISSGIGNGIFALPCLQALRAAGHEVTLWVDGDYPGLVDLWRRCVYVQDVIDGAQIGATLPVADHYVSGPWRPRAMKYAPSLRWYRWTGEGYAEPEWALFARAAMDLGCPVPATPGVSGWCKGLTPTASAAVDVGIIQGSKSGHVWVRKRYVGMAEVAQALHAHGYSVAWFGTAEDTAPPAGIEDRRGRYPLRDMPDVLAGCRVVVGTDSGMTHLAASLGIPTAFIFTATSPVKGAPVGTRWRILQTDLPCQPCQTTPRWHACHEWDCQEIAPAEVVQGVTEWLQ